jgi:hypothetical protein
MTIPPSITVHAAMGAAHGEEEERASKKGIEEASASMLSKAGSSGGQ